MYYWLKDTRYISRRFYLRFYNLVIMLHCVAGQVVARGKEVCVQSVGIYNVPASW